VDPNRIGLIGHSEGALVGSLVAAEDRQIAFLILLAGPGVPGDELLYVQAAKIARASGASEDDLAQNKATQEKLFGIIRNEPDVSKGLEEARRYLTMAPVALQQIADWLRTHKVTP